MSLSMREIASKVKKPVDVPEVDPMQTWAEFVVEKGYEDIPSEVIDHIKKLFLDTLGITIGGSKQLTVPEIVNLVKSWGGAEQSTILVYGGKVPAPNAAFAIGPMTRALDMGDTHPQCCHISEYVVPSLLPAAEWKGGVSGKEFLTAYALAAELGSRMGNACHSMGIGLQVGRQPQFGVFEATAAVGKLFGLDKLTLQHALGIAYHCMTARDYQMYFEGTLMQRGHHAFVCQDAINCVLLAQRGMTGALKVFTGEKGMFAIDYPWESEYGPLTEDMGKKWDLLRCSIKLYASCRCNHSPIDASLNIIKGNNIDFHDIAEINIEMDPGCKRLTGEPEDFRCWNPQTMAEGQFSLRFAVSCAIIKNKVFIDDYEPKEFYNKEVRALMEKVKKPTVNGDFQGFESSVSIKLKDGKEFTKRMTIDDIKGGVNNPLSWDDVIAKFNMSPPFGAVPFPRKNLDQIIEKCRNLEEVKDMVEIIRLMTP